MNYIARFREAITYTKELGLKPEIDHLPISKPINKESIQEILQFCADALYHYGHKSSKELAGKCTQVHMMLKEELMLQLNINSTITIGDKFYDDQIYNELTEDYIKNELSSPNKEKPINAHVWLTLDDGTIIDCTLEAHIDMMSKRGIFPAHRCISIFRPEEPDDAEKGYYRPKLVGIEFLIKTGAIRTEFIPFPYMPTI